MKNKLFYCFLLVLCIIFTSCSQKDITTSENTASASRDEQTATSAALQTTASADESIAANAEQIPLSSTERIASSSFFKGSVYLNGAERELLFRSAVILNEKLPFGAVMYLDVLDETGKIIFFRKCSGYGFIAADMKKETPSEFLFYSVTALENGMFEARTELIYFDDRDRLTAEPTGKLSAYVLDGSYSFKGDANDAVSMAGCADNFVVLADRTLEFLNGGDFSLAVVSLNDMFTGGLGFDMALTSVPSKELLLNNDMMNFVRSLNVDKFKTMYEKAYNK